MYDIDYILFLQSHAQCSETFYRREIECDIHTQPSKSTAERLKMMDLLKRFEEESGESEFDPFEAEAECETDLSRRLRGVDLGVQLPIFPI